MGLAFYAWKKQVNTTRDLAKYAFLFAAGLWLVASAVLFTLNVSWVSWTGAVVSALVGIFVDLVLENRGLTRI